MDVTDRKNPITRYLWPQGETTTTPQVYALLDAARDPAIEPLIRLSWHSYVCLFSGNLSAAMRAASPYLVQLSLNGRLFNDLMEKGWGRSWGMFLVAGPEISLGQLRKHLRHFLRVQDERGRHLLFRFYDPRVLSVYLPTCTTLELRNFMGPVQRLLMEQPYGSAALTCEVDKTGVTMSEMALEAPAPAASAG